MRTGEVFALTWDDIDFKNRIIKITKTVYAKDRSKMARWYIVSVKTEGSYREVYICDTLYSILSNYKDEQNENKKEYGSKYKNYTIVKIKNKYGKLVDYAIIESKTKRSQINMVFTRKDGRYSGTDVIKYPFKIIRNELGIKARLKILQKY